MHKKLADDLTSIAHSILRMKNKDDVFALKLKAHEVYEKLALLAYVEEYINTTPNTKLSKEELLAKVAGAEVLKEKTVEDTDEVVFETSNIQEDPTAEKIEFIEEVEVKEFVTKELKIEEEQVINEVNFDEVVLEENTIESKADVIEEIEQPFDEIEELLFGAPETEETTIDVVNEVKEVDEVVKVVEEIEEPKIVEEDNKLTLEEELGDTISVDVMANLFERVVPKKTLHDKLQNTIAIDLNDRIAFVKHLFNGNQEDFNRVISQLNTINTETGAKNFIQKMIKPDYNWSEKEEYEIRLMEIIERKFIV